MIDKPKRKDFHMLGGPPIPREMAEILYEIYCLLYGSDCQSLERIEKRDGFGYNEIKYLMSERQGRIRNNDKF